MSLPSHSPFALPIHRREWLKCGGMETLVGLLLGSLTQFVSANEQLPLMGRYLAVPSKSLCCSSGEPFVTPNIRSQRLPVVVGPSSRCRHQCAWIQFSELLPRKRPCQQTGRPLFDVHQQQDRRSTGHPMLTGRRRKRRTDRLAEHHVHRQTISSSGTRSPFS